MPMKTEDGVVKVDGKALKTEDGKEITAKVYVNGEVG